MLFTISMTGNDFMERDAEVIKLLMEVSKT